MARSAISAFDSGSDICLSELLRPSITPHKEQIRGSQHTRRTFVVSSATCISLYVGSLHGERFSCFFCFVLVDADFAFPTVASQPYSACVNPPSPCLLLLCTGTKDMGERKIHMQKPLFRALESLALRRIGPHFLLYASEDITEQYRR